MRQLLAEMGVGSLGELSKPRTFEDETAPAVHAADALKLREVGPPSLLPPSSKSRKRVLASQACARKPSVCSKAKRVLESQACARKSSVRSKVKRVLESQACARKSSVRCINARWCFSHGVPRDGAPAHLHRPPRPLTARGRSILLTKVNCTLHRSRAVSWQMPSTSGPRRCSVTPLPYCFPPTTRPTVL